MAISGEPNLEVGEPPGGEYGVVSMAIRGEPGPEVGDPPSIKTTALCVQFRPKRRPLRAPGSRWWLFHKALFVKLRSVPSRIAQGQQGRPCFAFLFQEDEERIQEGRRRGKIISAPSSYASCLINTLFSKTFLLFFPTHSFPSAAQILGVGLRRPCRGGLLAACLGDGARCPCATCHAMFNDHILAGSYLVLSPIF
jgi:hypothetical protein